MSDRVSWIEYNGAKILYADYSEASEEEFVKAIDEFKNELLKQTPGSVVTLTNITNATITNKVKGKFRELAEQTKGISKGTAAIGVTGFKKALAVLIKRDMYYANSLEEAKDWLAERANNK
jgi:PDZ domain-containing secreted protein